eukprot:COSAG03_NODE_379_length_8384_cov_1.929028_1_plen_143_part_10
MQLQRGGGELLRFASLLLSLYSERPLCVAGFAGFALGVLSCLADTVLVLAARCELSLLSLVFLCELGLGLLLGRGKPFLLQLYPPFLLLLVTLCSFPAPASVRTVGSVREVAVAGVRAPSRGMCSCTYNSCRADWKARFASPT